MWSSPILLEVVFFGVFKPIELWPEERFEHMKVIVLIDRFFKEVGTVDFLAGNGAPNQNSSSSSSSSLSSNFSQN